MNIDYINLLTNILKAGILLSIVMVSIGIAQTSAFINEPLIAWAITVDLTLTLPIAYWFFIRETKISRLTVLEILIFGIILAYLVLPENNRQLLDYLMYFVLPVIEAGALAYAGFIIYRSRKTFKSLDRDGKDFMEVLRETLGREFPSAVLAKALSFEITGFYYAFIAWKARRGERTFSYHRQTGVTALLFVFGFIIAVETFVLHFFVAKWSAVAAWILTALSIYFLVQIFAHGKAVRLRPVEIAGDKLFVRCGLLGDVEIELSNIASIDRLTSLFAPEKGEIKLSPLGDVSACNLKITLQTEAVLNGVYGKKKNFKAIALFIDEAESFISEIEKRIKQENQ